MAHFWLKTQGEDKEGWDILFLSFLCSYILSPEKGASLGSPDPDALESARDYHCVKPYTENGEERHVIMAGDREPLFINGRPAIAGMRVLKDRDEIRIGRRTRLFYSTEALALTQPFPHENPAICPRCATKINKGDMAVRCPNPHCGLWHHEAPEKNLNCWSYVEKCASARCDQKTAPEAANFQWTPEGL